MSNTNNVDPFAIVEAAAKKQKSLADSGKAIDKAIIRGFLFEKSPARAFFTVLVTKHQYQPTEDPAIDTAATNGKVVRYSPDYVNSLSQDQLVGLLAHEGLHPGFGHHARRKGREPRRWNEAADLEINPILSEAGYVLPPNGLFPGQGPERYRKLPPGLTAEEYYDRLHPLPPGKGDGGGDPGGSGGVEDAGPDESTQADSAADWKVGMAQAAAAGRQKGDLPGGLDRLVQRILLPQTPWQDELSDFVVRSLTARDDYSWSRPNRRFISQGVYLPSFSAGEELPWGVVHVDCSGSIGQDTLDVFGGEANGVLECNPAHVTIVYGDAAVQHVQEWRPGDGPLTLEAKGGGGTNHTHLWDWLKEQDEEPTFVICLTDGATDFGTDPGVPVLWALTADCNPPFGRKCMLK